MSIISDMCVDFVNDVLKTGNEIKEEICANYCKYNENGELRNSDGKIAEGSEETCYNCPLFKL